MKDFFIVEDLIIGFLLERSGGKMKMVKCAFRELPYKDVRRSSISINYRSLIRFGFFCSRSQSDYFFLDIKIKRVVAGKYKIIYKKYLR